LSPATRFLGPASTAPDSVWAENTVSYELRIVRIRFG